MKSETKVKDDLSNSIAQTVGAISGQFGGFSPAAIVEFLNTKKSMKDTCVSSIDFTVLTPESPEVSLWE